MLYILTCACSVLLGILSAREIFKFAKSRDFKGCPFSRFIGVALSVASVIGVYILGKNLIVWGGLLCR